MKQLSSLGWYMPLVGIDGPQNTRNPAPEWAYSAALPHLARTPLVVHQVIQAWTRRGVPPSAGQADQVSEDGPADAAAARVPRRVHGLDLRVPGLESLERADAEQFAVRAQAAERYRRIEQPVDVQGERVLGRRGGQHERQVPLEQRPDVGLTRVIDGDYCGGDHRCMVGGAGFGQVKPAPEHNALIKSAAGPIRTPVPAEQRA